MEILRRLEREQWVQGPGLPERQLVQVLEPSSSVRQLLLASQQTRSAHLGVRGKLRTYSLPLCTFRPCTDLSNRPELVPLRPE